VSKIEKLTNRDKALLIRSDLLSPMSETSARSVIDAASLLTLPSRHVLFTEASAAEHFYYVLNGHVRLFRTSRDGREADIRICSPGETFNDCMIFETGNHRYSAQTTECCLLARLELSRIRAMLEADPTVARAMIETLSKNNLKVMDCVANDRLQTAPQRVAHYLATQAPTDNGSYSLRLPFQKSVLAGKLGLAPEALSRAFSTLKSCGVSVRGRVIHIKDPAALNRL
jgi:CRP-like cAMP-binding protein